MQSKIHENRAFTPYKCAFLAEYKHRFGLATRLSRAY
jgi:hypothetical protein